MSGRGTVNLVELPDEVLDALRQLPDLVQFVRDAKAQRSHLTLIEAARRVRRRTADVRSAIERGELPARRSGRAWAVLASDVDAWAKGARS